MLDWFNPMSYTETAVEEKTLAEQALELAEQNPAVAAAAGVVGTGVVGGSAYAGKRLLSKAGVSGWMPSISMPTLSSITSRLPSMPSMSTFTSWMPSVSMPTFSSITSRLPSMPSLSSLTGWMPSISMPTLSSITSRLPSLPSLSSLTAWMPSFKRAAAEETASTVEAAPATKAAAVEPTAPEAGKGMFAGFTLAKLGLGGKKAADAEPKVVEKTLAELQQERDLLDGQRKKLAGYNPREAQKVKLQVAELDKVIAEMKNPAAAKKLK